MLKVLVLTSLTLCLLAPATLAAAEPQPDLRPLLDVQGNISGTDGPPSGTERFTIYQGGTLLYQARIFNGNCQVTTLALGPGSAEALQPLRRALRTGRVAGQKDCGVGFGFGTNIEYQVAWQGLDNRTNRFKFGTYYRTDCPAGVALIKKAYEDYIAAVMRDPATRVIRNTCPQ